MKYFAVLLRMLDIEKNKTYREDHLNYLKNIANEGKLFAKGRFLDATGGLVIYIAESEEEAQSLAENDPYILLGARTYEIHEWEMILSK